MSVESAALSMEREKPYQAILWGGLIAGIMDISAACIHAGLAAGRSPLFVLQFVASGLLGADSYNLGFRSAAVGLAVHFLIAYVACTLFYVASRKVTILVRQAIVCGLAYGIAVYAFMYLVVQPLTFHTSFFNRQVSAVLIGLGIHMFCVGLPIALVVRHFSKLGDH